MNNLHALDAAQSDPNLLGWMQGTPPPLGKRLARHGSHPLVGNIHLDSTSILAYHAIAEHLVDNTSL